MAKNSCELSVIGRVTDDINLEGQYENANFSIANNYSIKKGNEYVPETQFFNIRLAGQNAKYASNYIKKGSLVFVHGEFRTETWFAKDGSKKNKQILYGRTIELMQSKKDNSDNSSNNEDSSFAIDSDIPF